ncbi:MAG: hypothetical protein IKU72_05035 [Oscillospiraceae bacterium]|nr:hypothetical protein [Oscillospiraceae bacterium]
MGKEFKVMRRKNNYRSGRPALGQVILTVVVAAALFAAGWFLYQPAYSWIMSLAQPEEQAEDAPQTDEPASDQVADEPQQSEPLPEKWSEEMRAVWVPAHVAANGTMLEGYLSDLPGKPVNAVVLELKDVRGKVLYQSSVETVALSGAQSDGAFDLAAVAQLLHQKGYTVLGRLYAFEDSTATSVLEEGKVYYAGTGFSWLDNSASMGGKAWLNPYAAQAQDYIAGLAAEALSMGVDGIVLDGVQFPTGYSLEMADYGDTKNVSRPEVLSNFVARIEKLVELREGVGCWVYMNAAELYKAEEMGALGPYGGQAKQMVKDHNLMLNIMPASFGIGEETGLVLPNNPLQSPGETIAAALRELELPMDYAMVMPVLQAYTAADIAAEFNLEYGLEQVEQQVDAAEKIGVRSVVLYDPSGAYIALK